VATNSSHALRWFNAHFALGYAFFKASRIAATRSGASGFELFPRLTFAATGSVAAIARAFAPGGATDTVAVAFFSALFVCFTGTDATLLVATGLSLSTDN
jgi:hypothetical protein